MSRIATIRNAAIAAPKSPRESAMLAVVAAASAGTMRRREHAELRERRQHRHEQQAERRHESEPALGMVGRLAFRLCHRSACHLIPHEHEQRSAWMDRRLVSHARP